MRQRLRCIAHKRWRGTAGIRWRLSPEFTHPEVIRTRHLWKCHGAVEKACPSPDDKRHYPRIYRPMFEYDGLGACREYIILFSFETGHTRRPNAWLNQYWRASGARLHLGINSAIKSHRRAAALPSNVAPKRAQIGQLPLISVADSPVPGAVRTKCNSFGPSSKPVSVPRKAHES